MRAGKMGRRDEGRRLADPVSTTADYIVSPFFLPVIPFVKEPVLVFHAKC